MKATILAAGGALALASVVSAQVIPAAPTFETELITPTTSSTVSTPDAEQAPTLSTVVPSTEASETSETLEIMRILASMFAPDYDTTVTVVATTTLPSILERRIEVTSSSDAPADTTVTVVTTATVSILPDQTDIASNSIVLASTTVATDIASIQSANAEALQILRDERPVYSNEDVEAAKLHGFCGKNDKTKKLCGNLKTQVASCVDEKNSCDETTLRNTLRRAVSHNVCETTEFLSPEYAICARWYEEASRCHNKKRGRLCAIGHVKYLLRQLRDFIGSDATATTISYAGSKETGTARK